MELTAKRKAALLAYCRIDELSEDDTALLESLFSDAVAYMVGAGVSVPKSGTDREAQYDQCVNALVLDAWDHRGSQTAGQALVENPAFRRRLNQLKLTEPVSEYDTGSGRLGGAYGSQRRKT